MEEKIELMSRQFEKEGFTFSDLQKRQFYTFYEMLVEKNKVMNLTAITDFREAIEKHFIDSICICRIVDFKETDQIIDLGTGAGFTLALTVIGAIREVLGTGAVFGAHIFDESYGALLFVLAPGAFIVLGLLIALFNRLTCKK